MKDRQERACPRCGAAMRGGKLLAGMVGARLPIDWVPETPPKPGFFDPIRPDGGVPLNAHRCDGCGLVEFCALAEK
jgi:hypothetical protein